MTAFAMILLGMLILVSGSPPDSVPGNTESVNVEDPPKVDNPTVDNPPNGDVNNPPKVDEHPPGYNPPDVNKPAHDEPVIQAEVAPTARVLSSFAGRVEILGSSWNAFDTDVEFISEAVVSCFEERGIVVAIQFTKPFYGHVYPEGAWGTCESLTFKGEGKSIIHFIVQPGAAGCDRVIHTHLSTFAHMRLRVQWDPTFVTKDDRVIEVTCDDPDNGAFPEYDVKMWLMDKRAGKQLNRTFPGVEASLDVTLENADGRDVAIEYCDAQDDNMGYLEVLRDNCPVTTVPRNPFGVPITVSNGASSKTLRFHFDTFGLPTTDYVIIECNIHICQGSCVMKRCNDDSGQYDGNGQIIQTVTLFQFYSIVLPTVYIEHTTVCPEPVQCPFPSQAGTDAGFIGLGVAITIVSYFVFMRCKKDLENAKLRDKEKRSYTLPYMDDVPLRDMPRSMSEGSEGFRQDLVDDTHT